jgi:hypothetical protein
MSAKSVNRPGITAATLKANGIEYLDSIADLMEYGFKDPGIIIPYRKFPGGEAIIDGEYPYARLRLATPQGKKKYHQNFGTTVHLYIPVGLPQREVEQLAIVEGEFKADALVEAGIPAVGMSGFYGYRYGKKHPQAGQMVPELVAVLAVLKPKTILFLGDNDTALNFQFVDAAISFAKLVPKCNVRLPRIPLNMPKGIDDVRESLGGKFDAFWKSIVADAVPANGTDDRANLADTLLRRELDYIRQADVKQQQECYQKLAKMASYYKRAERERFITIARELGITTADFDKLLQDAYEKRSEEEKKMAGAGAPTRQPPATPVPATPSMPAAMIAPAKIVTWPRITNALDLINDKSIKLPPQLVEGLIHKGTKTVIGGCSKIGKTNIGLDLAFSVNAGVPFWGRKTKATKVLFINFEIQAPFMQQRLKAMREAKDIFDTPLPDVWSLRGCYPSAEELVAELLTVISKAEYGLIIIDPIYKLLGGLDESCGWQVNVISNQLDEICTKTGAAIVPSGSGTNGVATSGARLVTMPVGGRLVASGNVCAGTGVKPATQNVRPTALRILIVARTFADLFYCHHAQIHALAAGGLRAMDGQKIFPRFERRVAGGTHRINIIGVVKATGRLLRVNRVAMSRPRRCINFDFIRDGWPATLQNKP